MLNFDPLQEGLGLTSFVYGFSRKIFLMLLLPLKVAL